MTDTMEYKGYIGHVEYDPEAKIFHGKVALLKDVVTFQAKDISGLQQAFEDSMNDYFAFCTPKPSTS